MSLLGFIEPTNGRPHFGQGRTEFCNDADRQSAVNSGWNADPRSSFGKTIRLIGEGQGGFEVLTADCR